MMLCGIEAGAQALHFLGSTDLVLTVSYQVSGLILHGAERRLKGIAR